MNDLRLSLRSLLRAPGFTAAAVVVLALGIGGSTAVFSVLRGVVLRQLGLPNPGELVRVYERPAGMEARWGFSGPDYFDVARENGAFASVAGIRAATYTLTGRGAPMQLRVARVTVSFFDTLKLWPAIGHGLSAGEDLAGGPRTAVLLDSLWRREFGGDPAVIGKTITLDGRTYEIGGVMPADFRFPLLRQAEVLVPFALEGREKDFRGMYWVTTVGRLKPGAGIRQAQADLDLLAPRLDERSPEHVGWKMEAQPLLEDLVGPVKPALTALFAAVLLALLIACANVAGLFLARGMARQRELAIRAALGAGRGDLIRHLLAEAMALGVIGGGIGVIAAPWMLHALLAMAPQGLPRLDEVRLDAGVLAFAVVASAAAGLLAGLAPALQLTRPALMDVLKNGAAGTPSRSRARTALVVAETALAFVLAAGAGLMIRTLSGLLHVSTGLASPERVLAVDIDLPPARYPQERVAVFARDLVQRVSAVPGARAAALASTFPLDPRGHYEFGFSIEGEAPPPPGQDPTAEILFATPEWASTLGVPLVSGRGIEWTDTDKTPHAVVVNEAFVKRFLPQGNPIGRRIKQLVGQSDWPWTIVGVIGDVRTFGLDRSPKPLIAVPLLQFPVQSLRLAVRSASGNPMALLGPIRAEVAALDKDVPLTSPRTLLQVVDDSVGAQRFQMTLLSLFAALALTLAAVGIYGVMAYSVAQRSREIGIRMALGADSSLVQRMVVGSGLRLAAAGVVIGLAGAFAGTRLLASLVYSVSTTDPLTFAATAAVLIVSALFASWLPARRATRVDPAVALRAE